MKRASRSYPGDNFPDVPGVEWGIASRVAVKVMVVPSKQPTQWMPGIVVGVERGKRMWGVAVRITQPGEFSDAVIVVPPGFVRTLRRRTRRR